MGCYNRGGRSRVSRKQEGGSCQLAQLKKPGKGAWVQSGTGESPFIWVYVVRAVATNGASRGVGAALDCVRWVWI